MNIQAQLQEYNLDEEFLMKIAKEIDDIMNDYDSNAISKEMKDELVTDILELAYAKAQTESLDRKIKVEKFIDIVKSLAGIV